MFLSIQVTSGSTQNFDEGVLNYIRNNNVVNNFWGPVWLTTLMMDITALGGATVIFIITAAVVFYMLIKKEYELMRLILIAVVGGALLSFIMKELFARERPPLVYHLLTVKSLSFPSGHAMMSSVVYLTLGALLAKAQQNNNLKIYVLLVALLLVFLIGISRIYLGVHYPTDVFAGWSIGLVWASLCWLAAIYLQRRKNQRDRAAI